MYEKILAAKKSMEAKEAKKRKNNDPNKPVYEYDSDEDTEGGTWEHKKRKHEMEKTIGIVCCGCVHAVCVKKVNRALKCSCAFDIAYAFI